MSQTANRDGLSRTMQGEECPEEKESWPHSPVHQAVRLLVAEQRVRGVQAVAVVVVVAAADSAAATGRLAERVGVPGKVVQVLLLVPAGGADAWSKK